MSDAEVERFIGGLIDFIDNEDKREPSPTALAAPEGTPGRESVAVGEPTPVSENTTPVGKAEVAAAQATWVGWQPVHARTDSGSTASSSSVQTVSGSSIEDGDLGVSAPADAPVGRKRSRGRRGKGKGKGKGKGAVVLE